MNHLEVVRRQDKAKHISENPLTVYPPSPFHPPKFHLAGFETELNHMIFIFSGIAHPRLLPRMKRGTFRAVFLNLWWLGQGLHAGVQGLLCVVHDHHLDSRGLLENALDLPVDARILLEDPRCLLDDARSLHKNNQIPLRDARFHLKDPRCILDDGRSPHENTQIPHRDACHLHRDTRGLRDNARGLFEDIRSPHDHSYFREQIANSI